MTQEALAVQAQTTPDQPKKTQMSSFEYLVLSGVLFAGSIWLGKIAYDHLFCNNPAQSKPAKVEQPKDSYVRPGVSHSGGAFFVDGNKITCVDDVVFTCDDPETATAFSAKCDEVIGVLPSSFTPQQKISYARVKLYEVIKDRYVSREEVGLAKAESEASRLVFKFADLKR